jgi:hypothetical protein
VKTFSRLRTRQLWRSSVWAHEHAQASYEHTTVATQINRSRAKRALAILGDDPQFRHLTASKRGGVPRHETVLASLAKVRPDARLRAAATVICSRRLKARDALQWIAHLRRQVNSEGVHLPLVLN